MPGFPSRRRRLGSELQTACGANSSDVGITLLPKILVSDENREPSYVVTDLVNPGLRRLRCNWT
jgi:hypothetical protein